jgi:hypothetical protein
MFKNRKLEVRLVEDKSAAPKNTETEELPHLTPIEYAAIAEVAATRLAKKLILGTVVTVAAVAVIAVLANAADTALQNAVSPTE